MTTSTNKGKQMVQCTPISETNEAKRCLEPGPVQRNPYLNFLREYRKNFCGLSAVETVRKGAQARKKLSKEKRVRFIIEAYYAPKRRRRRRLRKLTGSAIGRRRLGIGKREHVPHVVPR